MNHPTADVIARHRGAVTFKVDEVAIEAHPDLESLGGLGVFEEMVGRAMISGSLDDSVVLLESTRTHPLISAVHTAFAKHLPLVLGPDMVWMTIAQGFALHVNNHAEAMRGRFVRHEGKQTLEVETFSLATSEAWAEVIEGWTSQLAEHVGPGLRNLMVCDFTTTSPAARTASQVVMMDAFKKYFDFVVMCVCGIPQITLEGTPEDWRSIRARVEVLGEYELSWWTDRLLPICDGLIETAEGRPPLAFWQNIYKPEPVYGEDVITGWVADLFPYTKDHQTNLFSVRNRILSKRRRIHGEAIRKKKAGGFLSIFTKATESEEIEVDDGLSSGLVPEGLNEVPFKLVVGRPPTAVSTEMSLVAGFVGVALDPSSGALRPELGWGVFEADAQAQLLARIAASHTIVPNVGDARVPEFPAFLVRLHAEHGAPRIHAETAWETHFRTLSEASYANGEPGASGTILADLADGRVVVCGQARTEAGWGWRILVGRVARPEGYDELVDSRPIAHSPQTFIERTLDTLGGYYFDAEGFEPR